MLVTFFLRYHHLGSLDTKRGFYSTPDLLELHIVFTVWETTNSFALPQTGEFCPECQSQTISEQTEKVSHWLYRANLFICFLPFDPNYFRNYNETASTFLDMKYKYLLFVFLYDLWLIFGFVYFMIVLLTSLETEPKVSEDRQRIETRILSPFHDEYI